MAAHPEARSRLAGVAREITRSRNARELPRPHLAVAGVCQVSRPLPASKDLIPRAALYTDWEQQLGEQLIGLAAARNANPLRITIAVPVPQERYLPPRRRRRWWLGRHVSLPCVCGQLESLTVYSQGHNQQTEFQLSKLLRLPDQEAQHARRPCRLPRRHRRNTAGRCRARPWRVPPRQTSRWARCSARAAGR